MSSQSNLSGYKAVIDAASLFNKAFPLMMTLQEQLHQQKVSYWCRSSWSSSNCNCKRLGAVVSSFDVRASTKEQVESLGAKFIQVEEKGDSGETAAGYAKEMSASYKKQAKFLRIVLQKQILLLQQH